MVRDARPRARGRARTMRVRDPPALALRRAPSMRFETPGPDPIVVAPTSMLAVVAVANLTANLSCRESIRVDVCIDRAAPHRGEQRVESCLAPGESLSGERQDHR